MVRRKTYRIQGEIEGAPYRLTAGFTEKSKIFTVKIFELKFLKQNICLLEGFLRLINVFEHCFTPDDN